METVQLIWIDLWNALGDNAERLSLIVSLIALLLQVLPRGKSRSQ